MSETARRHDIGRTLSVGWRRRYRDGELTGGAALLRLMPLTRAAPEAPAIPPAPEPKPVPEPVPEPVPKPVPKPVPAATDRPASTLLNRRRGSSAASLAPVMLTRLVQASDPS